MTGSGSMFPGVPIAFLVFLAGASPVVRGSEAAKEPDAAPVPALPQIALVPVDAARDDEAFFAQTAEQIASLVAEAGAAVEPLGRTDRLLAAANLILSFQLEPACSGAFLLLPAVQRPPYVPPPDEALSEAGNLLDQAGATLAVVKNDDERSAEVAQRALRLDVLRAFARAQRAYVAESVDDLEGIDPRRAASELSPLLENPDPGIAAAAKFWQTCLRAREEDVGPALARLEPALLPPMRDTQPYSFFARLLRCRLLAEEGHPATALALLLQIEERCHQAWFHRAELEPVMRTVALLRLQILRAWHDRLSPETQAAERTWCAARMEQIISARFGGQAQDVLRIAPAIPIVAAAPEPEPPAGTDDRLDAEAPPGTD